MKNDRFTEFSNTQAQLIRLCGRFAIVSKALNGCRTGNLYLFPIVLYVVAPRIVGGDRAFNTMERMVRSGG